MPVRPIAHRLPLESKSQSVSGLQRWSERECGDDRGCISRDETSGKPYWESSESNRRYPVPDREKGALRRLAEVMAAHPDYVAYHQGDPRGCVLYLVAKSDLNGCQIDQVYTRGLAVCY